MRRIQLGFILAALAVSLPGCLDGGPAAGVPTDIPAGPPPLPPGTSKEMTKRPPLKNAPQRPPV